MGSSGSLCAAKSVPRAIKLPRSVCITLPVPFNELDSICEQANRECLTVAIAMIDVDHFKAYNDRYGHPKGDDALRSVAAALQSFARRTDFVARYGGEECVIIFPSMDSPESALLRLAGAIDALGIAHEGPPFGRLTVSCGCAVFQPGSAMTPAMLNACNNLLYEAKAGGRSRMAPPSSPRMNWQRKASLREPIRQMPIDPSDWRQILFALIVFVLREGLDERAGRGLGGQTLDSGIDKAGVVGAVDSCRS